MILSFIAALILSFCFVCHVFFPNSLCVWTFWLWNMHARPLLLYLSRWIGWATCCRRSMGLRTKITRKPRFAFYTKHNAVMFHCPVLICFILFVFSSSHQMMKTVTTATSVLCVCLTCETRSSCPADTCVSATPARTHCVTRPTTVRSAGCVRAVIFIKFAP